MEFEQIATWRLRNAPRPLRAMAIAYILTLSLAYLYALGNIALVVGLTPSKIAIHYYGSEKKSEQRQESTGEEALNLDNLSVTTDSATEMAPRPSFKNLIAVSHFHLFGMASFFFGLTVLGLFTSIPEPWKTVFMVSPYFAAVLDNVSFLATRFGGPQFAFMTAFAGALMGVSFIVLWLAIAKELLTKKATA